MDACTEEISIKFFEDVMNLIDTPGTDDPNLLRTDEAILTKLFCAL